MLQPGDGGASGGPEGSSRELVVMMSVHEATERDLAKLPADLRDSALAALALALAKEIDSFTNSATSKSMCARAHQDVLRELRELAPPAEEADAVNDIESQRAKRLARVSRAADKPGS